MPSVKKQLAKYQSMRDFSKTAEPAGAKRTAKSPRKRATKSKLGFVIQKHAATALHYDLRLELDGVMKSWAVPKGPSLDPSVKRLAMQVEDHPIEYNEFEGLIPEGEYGGGTVMIWDRGTYSADKAEDGDHAQAVREGLRKGDLKVTFHGKRLKGSFVLVRTRGYGGKPQWLLIKHKDDHAAPGSDITAEQITSVVSKRTMEEIATEGSNVWHSNRAPRGKTTVAGARTIERARRADGAGGGTSTTRKKAGAKKTATKKTPAKKVVGARRTLELKSAVAPMLASLGKEMPTGDGWTYEPKYDGIRVLAFVTPHDIRLVTRNAKDKTKQFPEIIADLTKLLGRNANQVVLDGEIVALREGEPARFQELQSRMHVENEQSIKRLSKETPAAFVAFDILVDGDDILAAQPWSERRKRLQKRLARKNFAAIKLGESDTDGAVMMEQAIAHGWEGVIAKSIDSLYRPGVRSKEWLKLKLEKSQEFVVGGYTEPRNSREHIGAILLGYYDGDKLVYAGHTGGGFSGKSLQDMYRRLKPIERSDSPFATRPKTNEKPHWTDPEVVVEVRFNEWTRDGKLRQPIFLGVRDDKDPTEVRREE